ncbi:MAG: hypothetical protein CSA05_01385 [Bacteroidia bacterium]|nr:MAG: hypothetical protein CSA05_01385 [Bacteroidia bacterium]
MRLIWREFFMQIVYHFPKLVDSNFKSKYDALRWRNDKEEFGKWSRQRFDWLCKTNGKSSLFALFIVIFSIISYYFQLKQD